MREFRFLDRIETLGMETGTVPIIESTLGPSSSSFRITPKRRTILIALQDLACHPPADAIYLKAKESDRSISLSTVYRALDWLTDKGLIQRVEPGGGAARYCGNPTPHDHLYCIACGEVINAPTEVFDTSMSKLERVSGWRFRSRKVVLEGKCPSCIEAER